jgi:hypothetical protein
VPVYELSRANRMPVTSAVNVLERERGEAIAREKARHRAERENLPFVELPPVKFKGKHWAHRLEAKAEVQAARDAGTLVAGPDSAGVFAYFSTTPRRDPGSDDERERRAAMSARAAAAAQLVAHKPSARAASDALAEAVLRDGVPYADSLRLAHRWLGDSVGISGADMYAWRDSITELDATSRLWVAWALTIAGAEARMRWRHRRWDADDRAYLERLADKVGYLPTAWEKEQLARLDDANDSDGISVAEGA